MLKHKNFINFVLLKLIRFLLQVVRIHFQKNKSSSLETNFQHINQLRIRITGNLELLKFNKFRDIFKILEMMTLSYLNIQDGYAI